MHHAQVVSGDYAPGNFGFALHDRDAVTLDDLLVGKPTPALTGKAYVYFMGTRWSCSSVEATAFCNLETRPLNNIGAPYVPSCEQAIWWQDDPNFWHYLLVNNGGAGIQEAGATDAADIASRLASMVGISSLAGRLQDDLRLPGEQRRLRSSRHAAPSVRRLRLGVDLGSDRRAQSSYLQNS